MSNFEEFSEAALLYAENAPTVEAVRKMFEQELSDYLDVLADAVREELLPLPFQQETQVRYRYWWIGPPGSGRNDHLRFWFHCNKPEIVIPGTLELFAYKENLTDEIKNRIAALAHQSPTNEYCQPGKGWSFLNVQIGIDDSDRFIQPARQIAEVMRHLHEIDKTVNSAD